MDYGTSCDGGLLCERIAVGTAATIPPPSEPTEAQIVAALTAHHDLKHWERFPFSWRGFVAAGDHWPAIYVSHTRAALIARRYLARTREAVR